MKNKWTYDNKEKKDRNKIMLYLYTDDRLTLQEISDIYGVSRERVRQVISKFPEYDVMKQRAALDTKNKELIESLSEYRKDYNTRKRFWYYVDVGNDDECWEWTGAKNKISKYGIFQNRHISKKYNLKNYDYDYAHRTMWCVWNGKEIPDGMFICHTCDNPLCVNPHHLYLGTPSDNTSDRKERSGWVSYTRKLIDSEVEHIRDIFQKEGVSCIDNLADMYGVTATYIYIIGMGMDTRKTTDNNTLFAER